MRLHPVCQAIQTTIDKLQKEKRHVQSLIASKSAQDPDLILKRNELDGQIRAQKALLAKRMEEFLPLVDITLRIAFFWAGNQHKVTHIDSECEAIREELRELEAELGELTKPDSVNKLDSDPTDDPPPTLPPPETRVRIEAKRAEIKSKKAQLEQCLKEHPLVVALSVKKLAQSHGEKSIRLRSILINAEDHTSFWKIKHFFVLVLENRSFDHVFGASQITGTDARTGKPTTINGLTGDEFCWETSEKKKKVLVNVSEKAAFALEHDPPHEFGDTTRQLFEPQGEHNRGFVLAPGSNDALQCIQPSQLPYLTALAKEFMLCDNWYSAVPGPTFPNRMFLLAGSSDGINYSPSNERLVFAAADDGFTFSNGHIFQRLDEAGLDWHIVAADVKECMALTIEGISPLDIRPMDGIPLLVDSFERLLKDPAFNAAFTFIEPDYNAIESGYRDGNSMHPPGDFRAADALVKRVYEAIRNSAHWENSALIITFDEHGGFYDHVPPPSAAPPGDATSHTPMPDFKFDRLGVRVPAIVISPWTPKNSIDHRQYDHTSILKTLSSRFGSRWLTLRDAVSNSLLHAFNLSAFRYDAPAHLQPDVSGSARIMQPSPVDRAAVRSKPLRGC